MAITTERVQSKARLPGVQPKLLTITMSIIIDFTCRMVDHRRHPHRRKDLLAGSSIPLALLPLWRKAQHLFNIDKVMLCSK